MSREIRRDPTTGLYTIISTERVERPIHLEPRRVPKVPPAECPFCPGNEHATERVIDTLSDEAGWQVRAVANKYPALSATDALHSRAFGLYDRHSGTGAHEVIIEGRAHDVPLCAQPDDVMEATLIMARRRMADLHNDFRLRALTWFRNHGQDAGASQAHPHAQLIGLPFVPPLLAEMVARAAAHRAERGRDLLGDLLQQDLDEGARVVWRDDEIVAVCPWAPRAPFEVWFVPTREGAHFRHAAAAQLTSLARALCAVGTAIGRELEGPSHNLTLFTAPRDLPEGEGFRWHLRLQPRLEPGGGYEIGWCGAIVSVPPDEAAAALRG